MQYAAAHLMRRDLTDIIDYQATIHCACVSTDEVGLAVVASQQR